ncbi:aminodeoxychorismate synthase component I [Clostridium cylindrosporum]|uniref:Anthranilate synthase component 1 n=1 Tax=Clostridium cylindrosporum DSM 605 TaxID=1121307 RepID=A0A0J8G0J3_CLOCY|nr:aminodeoxychorismate synthase component I [Clostridium cylindrosporum]KMT21316.1 aminodeoxychorismate synthase component 1 [Clostridium cylindrosporum DSM 605]
MALTTLEYCLDPFYTYMKVKDKNTHLLESSLKVKDTGNYSIIVFNPKEVISYAGGKTYVERDGNKAEVKEDILSTLDKIILEKKQLGTGLIFDGGFVGYLSYDYGMELMGVPRTNPNSFEIPDIYFGYYEDFVVIDHVDSKTYIYTDNEEIIEELKSLKDLEYPRKDIEGVKLTSNFTKEEFENRVKSVRDYIKKGDVYEVNIAQQYSGYGSVNPYDVYSTFRKVNRGPYNAFMDISEGNYILSTSPEQFIRKRGNILTTRPIKGTVPRVDDKDENERLKDYLYNSEKTRSELLMIIDLERNDLSRVCIPGTVRVESLFDVEEYATVNHLVSTIAGDVSVDTTFGDIIRGTFPGGSITGAPKLRSLEVIDELESVSRGIYTGAIGYISNNGDFDFNIAIRTPVITNEGVFYSVGGGMVWDSDPEEEYEETLHKGKAINRSLTGKED